MAEPTRPRAKTNPNNDGRPSELDRHITIEDGRTITIADRLVELRGLGYSERRAATRAGIRVGVLDRWQREAATGEKRLAAYYGTQSDGTDPDQILTPHQRRCMNFCARYDAAWVRYIAGLQGTVQRLAMGSIEEEIVTEKVVDGKVVERTVRRSRTLPDRQAALELLRAAAPEEFGAKVQVDVALDQSGSSGSEIAELLDVYLQGKDAGQATVEAGS